MFELLQGGLPEIIGGVMIGLAAGGMLLSNGRILGISGIISGILKKPDSIELWRVLFLGGLLLGALGFHLFEKSLYTNLDSVSMESLALGGFLVGLGTTLGSGCTSGHGVCGLSRFSIRSIIATLVFVSSGMITVWIVGV